MFGQDYSVQAVATAGAPLVQSSRPPPEPRAVENVAKARVRQQSTGTTLAPPPTPAQRLSASARQFADVLDATGSLYMAASVSGFRAGQLDLYA
jgi:hypothetical protein